MCWNAHPSPSSTAAADECHILHEPQGCCVLVEGLGSEVL